MSTISVAKTTRNLLLSLVLVAGIFGPGLNLGRVSADGDTSVLTTDHDATVATAWMTLLYQRIEADKISAPAASRIYAYAGVTLYESVLPGMPNNNSLSGQLTQMPDMPLPDEKTVYDWPSSANAALATVIGGLLPSNDTQKAVAAMRESQTQARKSDSASDVVERSLKYGDSLGKAILAWVATDNFKETRDMAYTIPTDQPYDWVITTEGTKPVEPYWGQIRPFALEQSTLCNVPNNMPFSTDPSSTFYAQAMEVKEVHDNLTNEQKAIANFWVDTPGITGTPAGHWVSIETQLVDQLHLNLAKAAEMYALVGIALGDAFISCWELKYEVVLLRPETYIKKYIRRSFAPYIQTPPFPTYPSGHSVASAAAAQVLTGMFGSVAFKDDTHKIHNMPARFFTSFWAAADEAAISRLYGGIHYRVDIENGLEQGRCVGKNVLDHAQLRPQPQGQG